MEKCQEWKLETSLNRPQVAYDLALICQQPDRANILNLFKHDI